jgi:hypothetical protein
MNVVEAILQRLLGPIEFIRARNIYQEQMFIEIEFPTVTVPLKNAYHNPSRPQPITQLRPAGIAWWAVFGFLIQDATIRCGSGARVLGQNVVSLRWVRIGDENRVRPVAFWEAIAYGSRFDDGARLKQYLGDRMMFLVTSQLAKQLPLLADWEGIAWTAEYQKTVVRLLGLYPDPTPPTVHWWRDYLNERARRNEDSARRRNTNRNAPITVGQHRKHRKSDT